MSAQSAIDPAHLARSVRNLALGRPAGPPPPQLDESRGPVYAELRRGPAHLKAGWALQGAHAQSLAKLLTPLYQSAPDATHLLLCLGGEMRRVPIHEPAGWRHAEANASRGINGYALQFAERADGAGFVSPLTMVAQNQVFSEVLRQYAGQRRLTLDQARAGAVHVAEFPTAQYRIQFTDGDAPAIELCRGIPIVEPRDINQSYVERLEQLLSDYLVRSLQPDGRAVYLYLPSEGREDRGHNNAIRQWMATRILVRVLARQPRPELKAALHRNIRFNLAAMYAEQGALGLILDFDKVKLGAVALAALALIESPFANEFERETGRLLATVRHLWQPSGEFRTFFQPVDRNDCQNFYPGEALLLWATLIERGEGADFLENFWKSFSYYQPWHLANRNPAFIPWHTQAYFKLWHVTRDDRLPAAIFLMNDWLLDVQQWDKVPSPDCRGRFYDPQRPFGPPHASSTAVYLEGLADAFVLARQLGETARAALYRQTILRGLRSLAQLTFKDERDMFYIENPAELQGAVRTNEYDNTIRIDNVQHSLVAIQKILDAFAAEDYAPAV